MNRMKMGPLATPADVGDLDQGSKQGQSSHSPTANLPGDQVVKPGFPENWLGGQADADGGPLRPASAAPEVSFFIPVHYESGHSYPLVIWLHASGADQRQLSHVMPLIDERNYVGVSIRGTESLGNRRFGWLQSADAIEISSNHVKYAMDAASARFNIDTSRIFLAGHGAGGTMAFRIAFEHPERFAGVGSFNGSLPSTLTPLQNWRSCRRVPVFWVHGRNSIELPENNLCHQLKLLHIAGFDVTLRQYPCSDQLADQVYPDFNRWIMEMISRSGDANIVS